MSAKPEIQLSRLLDERGLSAFQVRVLIWSILIAVIDGYDITAISFAAPHLVASWGVERSALGPVLSASNFGFLFGAAIFGFIGDRYGRKTALISASLLFGVYLRGRLFDRPHTIVLAAGDCRARHRRSHSERCGDQC
jgi:MFS transporter, AAHS family, 4-hydroxybenzoate transporter